MKSVRAEFYDGQTSKPRWVNLEFSDEALIVQLENGESTSFPLKDVVVQPKVGSIPRVLELPNSACAYVSDHATFEKILPHKRDWIHILENNTKFVVGSFTGLIAFGLLLYFVIIPWTAKLASPKTTEMFGANITEDTITYLETTGMMEKEFKSKYYDRLESLREFEIMQPYANYNMYIYSAPSVGPNAFALPHNTIIITSQLFDLIEDDLEIVAILAHEVGHVKKYHVMERIITDSIVSVALFAIFGADWTSLPMVILSTSYSRDVEKEADLFAADLLKKHNMPPSLLGSALEKLEDVYKIKKDHKGASLLELFSSHPATQDRIEYLEKLDITEPVPQK